MVTARLAARSDISPPASPWEWLQCALLSGNLAWTTICLGGVRAETQVVTFALTLALLAVHLAARLLDPSAGPWHPAAWLPVPFLIYAAANVAWISPVPWLGWLDWLGWFQLTVVFAVLWNGLHARAARQMIFVVLIVLGIIGVLLACYQRFVQPDWIMLGRMRPGDLGGRASGLFGIPNSFAGFLLLLLPAVLALTIRRGASPAARVWWGWVAAVLFFGLILTISRGAAVALGIALIVWPLEAARGGWRRRVGLALLVMAGLAVGGGALYSRSPKVRARMAALVLDAGERTRPVLWRGAWELFREKPEFGWGGGSYNVMFERHRPEGFRDEPLWAHNDYLNTLSDYGAVGFTLLFGAAAAAAARGFRTRRAERSRRRDGVDSPLVIGACGVGLLAFGLQLLLDFHFKIPALALAFAVVAGLAAGGTWPPPAAAPEFARRRRWGLPVALAAAAMVVIGILLGPKIVAEAHRQNGRGALDQLFAVSPAAPEYQSRLASAREELDRAVRRDPANGQAWADLSYALALAALVNRGDTEPLGVRAEAAAERALGCSRVCSEFWIRRGIARDMQGRWPEAGRDFAAAVALAPNDAYAWYHTAEHLSRVKSQIEPAQAALDFCLRLDPGNAAGLALRQRLAINSKAH